MIDKNPIAKFVTQRRDELARLDTQLAAQEAGIQRRREEIAGELNELEIAVKVFENAMKRQPSEEIAATVGTENAAETNGTGPDLTGLKIADAAAAVLKYQGGQGRAADLLRVLQAAQRIAPGSNSYSTLHKTMAGDARFERVDRGLWRLKETSL